MNALTIISTLMFTKAGSTRLETATNVLCELNEMRKNKKLPFLTIHRAIKMQEKVVNEL